MNLYIHVKENRRRREINEPLQQYLSMLQYWDEKQNCWKTIIDVHKNKSSLELGDFYKEIDGL